LNKPLVILSVTALLAISGLYWYSQKPSPQNTPVEANQSDSNSEVNGGNAFEHILKMASQRVDNKVLDSVAMFQKDLESTNTETKIAAYKKVGDIWSRSGNIICGGHYFFEKAKITNALDDWRFASELMAYAADGAADTIARTYAIDMAIVGFRKVLEMDSTDVDTKVQLAVCLIDGKNKVMDGVLLLKQVEKVQPDHEFMNVTLGRLALISGQLDKAISRLERLTQKHPDNLEAYYYLSEAYRATGKKDQAIACLENAKKHFTKVPEAQKQIEELIQNIKKS
jgi:tetratricopeptide (TPR) repeat protein